MNREWFKYRLEKGHEEGSASFDIFAKWINVQLKIELKRRGPDRNEKSYASSLNAQKEKTELASSKLAYQPTHRQTPEKYNRSVAEDDPDLCVICRYSYPNRSLDHRTATCNILDAAPDRGIIDVDKRWDILRQYNVCFSCLKTGHRMNDCASPAPQCTKCNVGHSQQLLCKTRASPSGRFDNAKGSWRSPTGFNNRQQ